MGSAEPQVVTMRAFIIAALVASVYGEAKPYTVGQVLAGATNGGLITSTTYHGGLKVAGFPHAAVVPALGYSAPVVYGKREAEAEPYTVGQVLAGHTAGGVITSTTYAGGLRVAGLPIAHHYPVVYGKREAEPQFFQHHNLGAFATTNPVHAVAATPVGLTHSSNVGLCTNFVGAAVPC